MHTPATLLDGYEDTMASSRQDEILSAIRELDEKVDRHIEEDRTAFAELRGILIGDGKEQIGLVPRMVRLEETASTQRRIGNWLLTTIGGLLLTGLGTIAWALISLLKASGKLP